MNYVKSTPSLPLPFFFFIAFLTFWLAPLAFPSLRLFAFTPFLCIALQKKSLLPCLSLACICGLITDLLTTDTRFGLLTLSFVLSVIFAYRFRFYFFEDKVFALPLYTMWLSCILSILQFIFISSSPTLSLSFLASTFLLMPLIDGLYALICFTLPSLIFRRTR